jgi:hypothetical protein
VTAPAGAVIDSARPAVERLAGSRDPASLVAAWRAIESALQPVASDRSLSGQGLVRDLRQRNVLTLDQGHALIELLAAHDRAIVPGYAVTDADVQAARDALDQLAASPPTPIPAVPILAPPSPPAPAVSSPRSFNVLGFIALLVVIAGGVGYGVVQLRKRGGGGVSADDMVARGIATYQAGHIDSARVYFQHAVEHDSTDPVPHIYLGRIAREAGDLNTARNEMVTAVRLGPNNEIAQREMGAVLLAAGQYDLAGKFYLRAIALDSTDRSALGFYGCTLKRMGQAQAATQYLTRAGQGPWSACQ